MDSPHSPLSEGWRGHPEGSFLGDVVTLSVTMATKQDRPRIFRPWDSGEEIAAPKMEELLARPPDSFETYWAACIAAEVAAQANSRPATKQRPKKFRCPHCEVAFSNNGQLKGHVRIHTGERPFRCEAEGCGKSFTRNEELTRHKRIHSGLRPFPCESCGKTFGRKDHLKKHARTHLPQPAYLIPPPIIVYPYLYGY